MFKKNELKFLGSFYFSSLILGSLAVVSPYFVIYLQNLGLSFYQISLLSIVTGISIFLFEIPTGYFADKISRKFSVLLGLFISGIFLILMGIFSNFYLLFLFWFIIGFAFTLTSGADSAWVVDNLKNKKQNKLISEYYLKEHSISSLGIIISPLIAILIIKYFSLNYLWFVYGTGYILAFIILLFVPEYYVPKNNFKNNDKYFSKNEFKKIVYIITSNKKLLLLFLFPIFLVVTLSGNLGWQPFFISLGLNSIYLGFIYALLGVINVIIPFVISHKIKDENHFNFILILLIFYISLFIGVIFLGENSYIFAIIIFLLIISINNIIGLLIGIKLQHIISSKMRATINSIKSMVLVFISSIFILISGKLLDIFDFRIIFSIFGIFIIGCILIILKLKKLNTLNYNIKNGN